VGNESRLACLDALSDAHQAAVDVPLDRIDEE
jgi:hypothetical protein